MTETSAPSMLSPKVLIPFMLTGTIWGSTWFAITFQLGRVEPEASVTYRFLLASLLLFAYCAARRLPLRFSRRDHAWIAFRA